MVKNYKYSTKEISNLNEDIKQHFPHLFLIEKEYKHSLDQIQRLVMLDRYSQKDENNRTLKVGDIVVTIISFSNQFPARGIGRVVKINKLEVTIEIEKEYLSRCTNLIDGKYIVKNINHVHKPLELYWEQIAKRVSTSLANIEPSNEARIKYGEKFYNEIANFKIIPAGRVLYGAGSKNIVTLYNCFVMPLIKDSRRGISEHRKEVMEIMSRGGGVGTNGSTLRPRASIAKTVGGKSSGAVSWLNDIANLTHLVEQGGSRRGAQMIMLADWHPDIIEFIVSKMQKVDILQVLKEQGKNNFIREEASKKIKHSVKNKKIKELCDYLQTTETGILSEKSIDLIEEVNSNINDYEVINPYFLSGANISVTITHDFMQAVKKNADWELKFPDLDNYTADEKEFYDENWHLIGDVREWEKMGYKVKTYQTIKARHLWELIIFCATFSAEPGIFFIDTANDYTNAQGYNQKVVATNPCGEQPLAPYSVCNLLAINLAQFVDKKTCQIQREELIKTVKTCVRLGDNVIDLTHYFLTKNKTQAQGERRVGLGIMGLHDMLIYCKKRYGSKAGNSLTNEVMRIIAISAYEESIEISKQKGHFPFLNDREKFVQSKYIQSLPDYISDDIIKYGIRNSHLLTIAPTGTTGTLMNVSTGLEPYYALQYSRSGRLGQDISIQASIVQEMEKLHPDMTDKEKSEIFIGSMDLTPIEHTKVQTTIQRWVDSSISKTVNAPANFQVQQVGEIYMRLYDNNAKGGTVYVDGSRNEQVLNIKGDRIQIENQLRLKNLSFLNTTEDDEIEKITKGKVMQVDRTNRNIGYEIGDLCAQCRVGTMRVSGGCVECDNCSMQVKCGM